MPESPHSEVKNPEITSRALHSNPVQSSGGKRGDKVQGSLGSGHQTSRRQVVIARNAGRDGPLPGGAVAARKRIQANFATFSTAPSQAPFRSSTALKSDLFSSQYTRCPKHGRKGGRFVWDREKKGPMAGPRGTSGDFTCGQIADFARCGPKMRVNWPKSGSTGRKGIVQPICSTGQLVETDRGGVPLRPWVNWSRFNRGVP